MGLLKFNNWSLLLIFITVFMFLGAGKAFDHKINYPSPTGLMASDAFTHNWVSQNTYDTGYLNQLPEYNFDNEQEYKEKRDDYKMFHPPILPMITASISKLTNFNVHNVDIIIVFCLISLMVLLSYFILAKFSRTLALFSLPLTLLFLQRKFFISLTWGWWNYLVAEFFLFAVILLILNEEFEERYILNAILIITAFMAHGAEAALAAIFIAFYLIYNFFLNRERIRALIIEQIKSILFFSLIGFYPINIFLKSWGTMGGSGFAFISYNKLISTTYNADFIFFSEFINFRFLIIIGLLILFYFLITKKSELLSYYFFVIFMSLTPYLYFTGGERGLQWRLVWPIYLSFAFGSIGLLIYSLVRKHVKWKTPLKLLIFICLLGFLLFTVYPLPFQGQGVVSALEYDAYKWVHANTNIYSDVLVMYSPQNSQITSRYLLKRNLFVSRPETTEMMGVDSEKISLLINPKMNADFFCKKEDCSFFGESNFSEYRKEGLKYYENKSICSFDYVYMSLRNYEPIGKKNANYVQNLINKNISQIVFNNNGAVIAKNIVKGEECERRFKS